MRKLKQLFDNNRAWAGHMVQRDPDFFTRLSRQQAPEYLWIGCADSRVPANEIVGLLPGHLFVHRNVANVVGDTDLNCLSVLQYAVEILRVRHIIVCGHYGCGGVQSAVRNERLGLIDNWLRCVREVKHKHSEMLAGVLEEPVLMDRVCELNVIEQAYNVSKTTVVEDAWWHGQDLSVHGWIYELNDGLLRDLGFCVSRQEEVEVAYAAAVKAIGATSVNSGMLAPKASVAPTPRPAQAAPKPAAPVPAATRSSEAPTVIKRVQGTPKNQPPPLPRLK
ncbi:MAG: carbonate dehydratase [Candidatus Hydrogenedentes bacterium]|nr:carbonate dehydratase [Candidatus Hydrogenedentota bacterium]